MTADPDTLARLDRIAGLLEQLLVAVRPPAGADLPAADIEVLALLRELLCAPPWVRPRCFTSREALAMASASPAVGERLAAALGATPDRLLHPNTSRALGKVLDRIEKQDIDGAVVTRRAAVRGATIWQVERVDAGCATRDTCQSAARPA